MLVYLSIAGLFAMKLSFADLSLTALHLFQNTDAISFSLIPLYVSSINLVFHLCVVARYMNYSISLHSPTLQNYRERDLALKILMETLAKLFLFGLFSHRCPSQPPPSNELSTPLGLCSS